MVGNLKKPKQRKEKLPLPDGYVLDGLIQYYDAGWRFGYLKKTRSNGHEIGIQPIMGYKHSTAKNLIWYPLTDTKAVEGKDEPREQEKIIPIKRKKIRKIVSH